MEDAFTLCERFLLIGGIWPLKMSYVRFSIYCLYFTSFLLLTYAAIFEMVDLMIVNIMESIIYTITFITVLVLRFNKLLKRILKLVKKNIADYKFENEEERRIYHTYNFVSKTFTKVTHVQMISAAVYYYFKPLINYVIYNSDNLNDTKSLKLPYRIYGANLFDTLDLRASVLVYLSMFPVVYISATHMSSICCLVSLGLHFCAELSILSYRIGNIDADSEKNVNDRIRSLIRMHLRIKWMVKSTDEAFSIALFFELMGNSATMAICLFYALLSFEAADMSSCGSFMSYYLIALVILYTFCAISNEIMQQSIKLQDAYYKCNWPDMTQSNKKLLIVSMINSQLILRLTAAKCYTFCLSGFTDIMRTSMAYLSMLRAVM